MFQFQDGAIDSCISQHNKMVLLCFNSKDGAIDSSGESDALNLASLFQFQRCAIDK